MQKEGSKVETHDLCCVRYYACCLMFNVAAYDVKHGENRKEEEEMEMC